MGGSSLSSLCCVWGWLDDGTDALLLFYQINEWDNWPRVRFLMGLFLLLVLFWLGIGSDGIDSSSLFDRVIGWSIEGGNLSPSGMMTGWNVEVDSQLLSGLVVGWIVVVGN